MDHLLKVPIIYWLEGDYLDVEAFILDAYI